MSRPYPRVYHLRSYPITLKVCDAHPISTYPNHNPTVLIIGNGSYQPIDTYISTTSSLYPIYTDPNNKLHAILKFVSSLKMTNEGEEQKDYMRSAPSPLMRIFNGVTYALGHLQHTAYAGPKSLNGGEVVISAGM